MPFILMISSSRCAGGYNMLTARIDRPPGAPIAQSRRLADRMPVTLARRHRINIHELSAGLRNANAAAPLDHGRGLGGCVRRAAPADLQLLSISPRQRNRRRGTDFGHVRESLALARSLPPRRRGLLHLAVLDRASRRDRLSAHPPPILAAASGPRDSLRHDARARRTTCLRSESPRGAYEGSPRT